MNMFTIFLRNNQIISGGTFFLNLDEITLVQFLAEIHYELVNDFCFYRVYIWIRNNLGKNFLKMLWPLSKICVEKYKFSINVWQGSYPHSWNLYIDFCKNSSKETSTNSSRNVQRKQEFYQ